MNQTSERNGVTLTTAEYKNEVCVLLTRAVENGDQEILDAAAACVMEVSGSLSSDNAERIDDVILGELQTCSVCREGYRPRIGCACGYEEIFP